MILLNLAVVGALAAGSLALVQDPPGPDTDDCRTATSSEAAARVAADAAVKAHTDALKVAETDDPATADVDESPITEAERATLNPLEGEKLRLAALLDAAIVVRVSECTAPPTSSTPPPPPPVSPPADCDTARELGIPLPIRRGDPRFAPELDRDDDGLACEVNETDPAPSVVVPGGAPNTGRR